MRGPQLLAGVDAAVLAAQPLAVDELGAGELDARRGCGRAARSPRGRALGRLARRSAARASAPRMPQRPVGAARAASDSASRSQRVGRALRLAGSRTAASTSSASAHVGDAELLRVLARRARPRPARPRSGRGRCRAPRCPSRWRRATRALAARTAACRRASISASASALLARARWPARSRRAGDVALPVASMTASASATSAVAAASSPRAELGRDAVAQRHRQHGQRAGPPGELRLARRESSSQLSSSHSVAGDVRHASQSQRSPSSLASGLVAEARAARAAAPALPAA